MPSFEYRGIDRQGNSVEGQVQANTREEAAVSLSKSGLLVSRVAEIGGMPAVRATAPAPIQQSRPAPANPGLPRQIVPSPTRQESRPQPTQVHHVATPHGPRTYVRFKGSDKQLNFLFSQFATMVRSGLTPQVSAGHLANRVSHPAYLKSIEDLSKSTGEGSRLSKVMERYPELYPPNVVATVKAGEEGGFLPEALQEVADWAEASHVFKRRFWLMKVMFIGLPAIYPLSMAAVQGSLRAIKLQDQAGGSLDPVGTVGKQIAFSLPMAVLTYAIGFSLLFLARYLWLSGKATLLRHRLVALLPGLGGRARAEALSSFAWVFGRLSSVGIAPQQAWLIASDAMPNLWMADRLRSVGEAMSGSVKASELMRKDHDIIPPEFGDIVETGELSGDIPGALATMARTMDAEFGSRERASQFIIYLYTYLPAGVIVLWLVYLLYKTFYGGMIPIILGDD